MKVHCLFEQSGTFKNEFIKLGYDSFDYDIRNDFKQTDYVVDIFDEIDKAILNLDSIFSNINQDDLIFAFFPCVRFQNEIGMSFRGDRKDLINKCLRDKLVIDLKLHKELSMFYEYITKLVVLCIDKNLKLIIENPYSTQHYLIRYWAFKSTIIDYDRSERGDDYKKPTQYWFLNISPKNNLILEDIAKVQNRFVQNESNVNRSMISSVYANRFIREFIL